MHEIIEGPAGPLEALVDASDAAAATAVICHPHPLHQGSMHNKVVHTLARTFARAGIAAVRFNFRGVGASGGVYDEGVGERDDLLAAVRWALDARPGAALYLAGFSFGAWIAAMTAPRLPVKALIGVAPPVKRFPEAFRAPRCPWLIVHGGRDELVAPGEVRAWRERCAPGAELVIIQDATHFFHGKLNAVADEVQRFVRRGSAAHRDEERAEARRAGP